MFANARAVTLMPIRDMNRAIKFYTKTLGGKMGDRGRGRMRNFWASVKLGDHDVWLIAPPKPEKRKLAYTNFLVKNIRTAVKQLRKNGVRFQRAESMGSDSKIEGPITWESFGGSAFFKDSEGNLLMVWQNIPPM